MDGVGFVQFKKRLAMNGPMGLAVNTAVAAGVAPVAGAAGADEGAGGFVAAGLPVRWGVGMGAFRAGLGG